MRQQACSTRSQGTTWTILAPNLSFRDISVAGMILPKDTMVFPLFSEILKVAINCFKVDIHCIALATKIFLWLIKSIYMQGSHWEGGDELKPERFLDEEGKVLRDEHLIPFSIGSLHKQCQNLNDN